MKINIKKWMKTFALILLFILLIPVVIMLLKPDLLSLIRKPQAKRSKVSKRVAKNKKIPQSEIKQVIPDYNFYIYALDNLRMMEESMRADRQMSIYFNMDDDLDIPEIPLNDSWLPENVRPIFDILDKQTFTQKLKAVHALKKNLSKKERNALYYFIDSRPDNEEGYVLKNDIMNALRNQAATPEEYADIMIHFFKDKNMDTTTRMYILQHLRPWYEEKEYDRDRIRQLFYDALEETDNGIAGTSLLALNSLSTDFNDFDTDLIATAAAKIAESTSSSTLSRISAIQICGQMNLIKTRKFMKELLQQEQLTSVKLAAIATLGDIGTQQDIDFLTSIGEDEKNFRKAIVLSIKKLRKKTL